MPHSTTADIGPLMGRWQSLPDAWRRGLIPLWLSWALIAAIFASDWITIATLAWDKSTFNHILLIPLILIWLVTQRWQQLRQLEPSAWWPGLLLSAAGMVMWLLGAFSGLDAARQLGAVLLLISTVPLFLGLRVSAGLTFPLFYGLLLVPLGEELVPALQMITAEITVFLVSLSGILAEVDGVFIDTPAGLFEVAEACSGVKFLIAMIALGLFVANVCFISWRRRALFLTACVVVPILANGIRAFATIYVAQSIGAEAAVGFDHLIYGWFFFGIVMAILLAGAWKFFDRPPGAPMIDADKIRDSAVLRRIDGQRGIAVIPALALLVGLAVSVQAWAKAADALAAPLPHQITLPMVDGWQIVEHTPQLAWEPQAQGAEHRLMGRYENAEGQQVDVFYALYSSQGEGREAGGFGQGALTPGGRWSWQSPAARIANGRSEWLRGDNGQLRLAVTWYRSGNALTGSNVRLKITNMFDRIRLRAPATAMLILSAIDSENMSSTEAVRTFLDDAGPVDGWMDRIAEVS